MLPPHIGRVMTMPTASHYRAVIPTIKGPAVCNTYVYAFSLSSKLDLFDFKENRTNIYVF